MWQQYASVSPYADDLKLYSHSIVWRKWHSKLKYLLFQETAYYINNTLPSWGVKIYTKCDVTSYKPKRQPKFTPLRCKSNTSFCQHNSLVLFKKTMMLTHSGFGGKFAQSSQSIDVVTKVHRSI